VRFFALLALMIAAGRFSAELFERFGQPPVLGELIAGILLGASVFNVIPVGPDDALTPVVELLAEIGVVVLLFEIGLETDLRAMRRVGGAAAAVALVGVALPFGLGLAYWLSPLNPYEHTAAGAGTTAVFVGAALTATSVGITARVLADLKVMPTVEAQLVLGAAVIDDVIGLVLLGIVSGLAAGATLTVFDVTRRLVMAVGFLVVAIAIGLALAPRLFAWVDQMRVRGMTLVVGFAFILGLSAIADSVGSALIIGAFASGIILAGTRQVKVIERGTQPLADIFTPVFFLLIGARVDLRVFNPADPTTRGVLLIGAVLSVIAIVTKLAAGWAPFWQRCNRWAVGFGMVPRGEVGLIFANIGLSVGVLSQSLFTAILLMVMVTTFIAPLLLKWAFSRWGSHAAEAVATAPAHVGGSGH
jgi:Kef-type K+ transport system membrane component KefB